MKTTKRLAGKLTFVLCGSLLGYTAYGQPSVSVGVSVPAPSVAVVLPSVVIHAESDFYEPLTPHGEWVVVGSYGRCWKPARVARDWRPYCNGYWQRTDVGWYWVSDEPWAWATYHYGRWDFTEQYGWYWVPQTQWAPAWVSWHEGGGYVGWAPLQPSVRISVSGYAGFNEARIAPRAFVFVEQRRFLDPIRPATVVVDNTIILKKTVNITNIKVVNNTVINEGPATTAIAKASGRKVPEAQVRELRRNDEAAFVARNHQGRGEKHQPVSATPEFNPEGNRPPAGREPNGQNTDKQFEKQERPARERPSPGEKNGPGPTDKGHEKRSK